MCPTYKVLYQRIPIAVDVNTCNLNSSLQTPSQCFVQLLRTIQRNRMKSKYGVPFPFYVPRHCLRVVITTLCRLTVHENVIQNVGSVCIFSFKVITRGSQNSHSEVPKNRPWTNPPTPMEKMSGFTHVPSFSLSVSETRSSRSSWSESSRFLWKPDTRRSFSFSSLSPSRLLFLLDTRITRFFSCGQLRWCIGMRSL